MDRLRRNRNSKSAGWKVCLQCGNRYRAGRHGYRVNWCSTGCENAALRRQREEIEASWIRTRWFLR